MTQWWKNKVVYQIYPRSFQDSNQDGIGDIAGIVSRLDYLKTLGVGAIWLSPVYRSPNFDNGYDISDFTTINPEFGTMADFEHLLAEADKRGMAIIMDLVLNHTSDQHPWFLEAKKGRGNPYRDHYIWRDPVAGVEPNDLRGGFGGSAWELDPSSGQYYFHLFSKHQPDLNWENPMMRQELWRMMNFWLEKGIKGFRLDVIDLIGKVPDQKITVNGPHLHTYLQEMYRETFGKYDTLTVGEAWSASPEIAQMYSMPDRQELSMVFSFEHMVLDEVPGTSKWQVKSFTLPELKRAIAKWQLALSEKGWNSLFWNNHDLPRMVSRWGNDQEYRVESAKMLAILLHLLKGTPFIYQGEEIGMTNFPFTHYDQLRDIEAKMMYSEWRERGYTEEEILAAIRKKGRDNPRTPMQWENRKFAGFSEVEPWMTVNPNYPTINVLGDLVDLNSVFYTYKRLVHLRKEDSLLVHGTFRLLLPDHPKLFIYERAYEGRKWLVVANMCEEKLVHQLSKSSETHQTIIGNYPRPVYRLDTLELEPYETFVVEVKGNLK